MIRAWDAWVRVGDRRAVRMIRPCGYPATIIDPEVLPHVTVNMTPAIVVYDHERLNRYADPDLDLAYIDRVAAFVADSLWDNIPAEVAFQPGDGTRYNLVFVPPTSLATAPPRRDWERHALTGIRRANAAQDTPAGDYYASGSALVVWVEHASHSVNFDADIHADYVAQKFGTTIVSGCTLAILFRAIDHYLRR